MNQLTTPYGTFKLIQFETEHEFERAIVAHVHEIFGERRIYQKNAVKPRPSGLGI